MKKISYEQWDSMTEDDKMGYARAEYIRRQYEAERTRRMLRLPFVAIGLLVILLIIAHFSK